MHIHVDMILSLFMTCKQEHPCYRRFKCKLLVNCVFNFLFQEVLRYYEILRKQFPGASFAASTFDEYFAALLPIKSKLPVVTGEISDTWIQGIASDPRKMAEYRAVSRVLSNCTGMGRSQCNTKSGRVSNGDGA